MYEVSYVADRDTLFSGYCEDLIMSHTVLCIVEMDNYPETVVERAAWLAKSHDCDLRLLVSEPWSSALGATYVTFLQTELIEESIRASREEAEAALIRIAEDAGVEVTVEVSTERSVADAVIEAAFKCKPRFVVKGTHYHSALERATHADADWQLIRQLDFPLWFVKPKAWGEKPVILAAVDPTHANDKPASLDRQIIRMSQSLAEKSGGKLELIHTYQRLGEIGARAMWSFKPEKLDIEEIDRKIQDEHRKALESLSDDCGVDRKALHLLPGRAHEVLPAFARDCKASLVVMGALARSALKQRIVGSTAARVLDHLPCDVLFVHARDNAD